MIRIQLDRDKGLNTRYPSGRVLNAQGMVIGDAQSYTYGGTAFAVHCREFAGYVRFEECEFVTAHKLTQRIVRDFVRTLGGTFKATGFDDYKVRFDRGESEYFANDLQDALETARAMKGGHPMIQDAEEQLRVELGLVALEMNA